MRKRMIEAIDTPIKHLRSIAKYQWIQLLPEEVSDIHATGKYHPKSTFLFGGYSDYEGCYKLINLYGEVKRIGSSIKVRRFPPLEQIYLTEEFGEALTEHLTENQINNLLKEWRIECIV